MDIFIYFYESNSLSLRFSCHKYQNQFRCVFAMSNFFSGGWVLAKYLIDFDLPNQKLQGQIDDLK